MFPKRYYTITMKYQFDNIHSSLIYNRNQVSSIMQYEELTVSSN